MEYELLTEFYSFANRVAKLLNDAKVEPSKAEMTALMVVVGGDDKKEPPIGGAINYDYVKKVWEVDIQLEHPTRVRK